MAGSPARLSATGTTAEDLLSLVLGRGSPSLAPARLRAGSEASAAPFLSTPLGSSPQQHLQPPNSMPVHSLPNVNPAGFASSMPYSASYRQDAPSKIMPFDRTVGGITTNAYQNHQRTGSLSNVSSSPHSTSTVFQRRYDTPGSPSQRGINPLGAIGTFGPLATAYEAPRHQVQNSLEYSHHALPGVGLNLNALLPPAQIRPNAAEYMASDHRPWS